LKRAGYDCESEPALLLLYSTYNPFVNKHNHKKIAFDSYLFPSYIIQLPLVNHRTLYPIN
jgi:hypothetical protein